MLIFFTQQGLFIMDPSVVFKGEENKKMIF